MRRLLYFCVALLLLPSGMVQAQKLLHSHRLDSTAADLVAGGQLTFSFLSQENNELLKFNIQIPVLPGPDVWIERQYNYYEANAPSLGVNWSDIEDALSGPLGQQTKLLAPGGQSTTINFPFRHTAPGVPGYSVVDLSRIAVEYRGPEARTVHVVFWGVGVPIPEPTSCFIALTGIAACVVLRRRAV